MAIDQDDGVLLREQLSGLVIKDWNVNVSGKGKITPFEQYSICCMCMVARRDFRQEIVAPGCMWDDVHQVTISRYMSIAIMVKDILKCVSSRK